MLLLSMLFSSVGWAARRVETRPTLKRTRARDVAVPTRAVSIGNIRVRLAIYLRK